jgi:hypothetical protein
VDREGGRARHRAAHRARSRPHLDRGVDAAVTVAEEGGVASVFFFHFHNSTNSTSSTSTSNSNSTSNSTSSTSAPAPGPGPRWGSTAGDAETEGEEGAVDDTERQGMGRGWGRGGLPAHGRRTRRSCSRGRRVTLDATFRGPGTGKRVQASCVWYAGFYLRASPMLISSSHHAELKCNIWHSQECRL